MAFQLAQAEGEFLVELARKTVEAYLKTGRVLNVPEKTPPKLMQHCGVFITINKINNGRKELRGCIGYPYPNTMLAQAVIECAISSATQDPRFPPLSLSEIDQVVFEISVLTPPEVIVTKNPKEIPSRVKIGGDGLIVERGFRKGLLLPQVPMEYNWDEEEFLCQCCIKAGLSPDSWLLKATKIYRFQAAVFEEETPRGKVKRKELSGR